MSRRRWACSPREAPRSRERNPHDWHFREKDLGDRFKVFVADRSVAVAKSQPRSEPRRKLVLEFCKIGFFILFQEETGLGE